MKILFDTSVLVAGLVQPHPAHDRALPWLKKAKLKDIDMVVSSHTLAELYSVLTTLPVSPKITPGISWRLIHENIESAASIISLSSSDYIATIKHLSEMGLSGGLIYDALIFKTAIKAGANRILTFNVPDFKRIWPHEAIQILSP